MIPLAERLVLGALNAGAEVRGPCPQGWMTLARPDSREMHVSPQLWASVQDLLKPALTAPPATPPR